MSRDAVAPAAERADREAQTLRRHRATVTGAFPGLRPVQADRLLADVRLRLCDAGTVLCHEGELEAVLYVLLEGEVDVTVAMPDGGVRALARLGPGSIFGEVALIEDIPRTATVAAACAVVVAEFSKETFEALLTSAPPVAAAVLKAVSAKLRATDRQAIADLSRQNAELEEALAALRQAQAELVVQERMARDLEIAREVQQSLLPRSFPTASGWSFHGRNVAANAIGGDYFDVIPRGDGKIALLLADVADKSVHAALYMAVLRTLFVTETERALSPRETMLAVHRGYYAAAPYGETFATAFYGVLDAASGSLAYVRAGHELPVIVRCGGGSEMLDADGRFIGMVEDLELEERETVLEPGDALLVYSDGVPDAVDALGASYGMDRFVKAVRRNRASPAEALGEGVLKDILRHRGEAPAQDDITLLVAKRLG